MPLLTVMSVIVSFAILTTLPAPAPCLRSPSSSGQPAGAPATVPVRLAVARGFAIPESARFDPERDAYFVSNVNAHATRADNNGFISILSPDGEVIEPRFVAGGERGVTLHAPKGMAIRGRELWVTDVTVLRRFDRVTGAAGAPIDLGPHGAVFLNDITTAPDGTFYVSDTSFVFAADGAVTRGGTDRVYRIDLSGAVSVAVADPRLAGPNGVFWDTRGNRLLVASLAGKNIFAWTATGGLVLAASGPGGYDGVDALADGTVVVSSQDLPGVLVLDGTSLRPIITGVTDTGDLGVDTKRRRIAIPRLEAHVVELWQLPQ
jgi:sugar lactone lactonase YvrE